MVKISTFLPEEESPQSKTSRSSIQGPQAPVGDAWHWMGRVDWPPPLCILCPLSAERLAGMFWATYLEAACPGASLLCSAEGAGPDLLSVSSGWCQRPNLELWGSPSESPNLGFFGSFGGRIPSPPGLETKEDEGEGDGGSMHCRGRPPHTSGPLMQHEQACAKGRKSLLWCLPGEWEMRWNFIQVGPRSLHGHGIQRLLSYGLVTTDIQSWGDWAWLGTTRDNLAQLTVSLRKCWEVCAGSFGSQFKCPCSGILAFSTEQLLSGPCSVLLTSQLLQVSDALGHFLSPPLQPVPCKEGPHLSHSLLGLKYLEEHLINRWCSINTWQMTE